MSAVTAITIIQSALEEIGQYDPANVITDADAERCLAVLNDMMDDWSNQRQACFCFLTQSFPLVVNKVVYSIGPFVGCDIVGTRPLKLIQSFLTDDNNNNYQIQVIESYEWNQITNKLIDGQVPSVVWYDAQDPIGFLNIWPSPILNWTMSIVTSQQLTGFPSLATPVVLPRGYVPAIKSNLAVAIAPFFGMIAPPTTVELAARYLGNIKRTNAIDIPAQYDSEIVSRGNGAYSVFTDSWGGSRGNFGG